MLSTILAVKAHVAAGKKEGGGKGGQEGAAAGGGEGGGGGQGGAGALFNTLKERNIPIKNGTLTHQRQQEKKLKIDQKLTLCLLLQSFL